ncbi:MAG: hypothetical protein ACXAEN_22785 [Candidatus Thorarchaeota archaeon]|jgi:hypothetical protein
MNYRHSELMAAESISTAGTKTVDINLADAISRISLIVNLTNASWTPTDHPAKVLKSIDLVDGSNVIYSLSGGQCKALDFYDVGHSAHDEVNYDDNGISRCTYHLNFGRELFDEELGLDPARFSNLQLKINHDYSLGSGAPDAATLAVFADLFDEKRPTFQGYLMAKELYSVDSVSAQTKYVDLPTDHPIRKLMVMCWHDNECPDLTVGNVKITEEHDKRILVDTGIMEWIRTQMNRYAPYEEYLCGRTGATIAFYGSPHFDVNWVVVANGTTLADVFRTWSGGGKQVIDADTDGDFIAHVSGQCPMGAVPFCFGKQDQIGDWWDVTRLGSARLKIVQGTIGTADTSATLDVVTQQMVRY